MGDRIKLFEAKLTEASDEKVGVGFMDKNELDDWIEVLKSKKIPILSQEDAKNDNDLNRVYVSVDAMKGVYGDDWEKSIPSDFKTISSYGV